MTQTQNRSRHDKTIDGTGLIWEPVHRIIKGDRIKYLPRLTTWTGPEKVNDNLHSFKG